MANGKKKRGFVTYKSYLFTEKDPILDATRTMVQDSGLSYEDLKDKGGASTSTYYNWFHGNTKRPQFCTIAATALACGKRHISFWGGKPRFE